MVSIIDPLVGANLLVRLDIGQSRRSVPTRSIIVPIAIECIGYVTRERAAESKATRFVSARDKNKHTPSRLLLSTG
jgi:hypothetical protein